MGLYFSLPLLSLMDTRKTHTRRAARSVFFFFFFLNSFLYLFYKFFFAFFFIIPGETCSFECVCVCVALVIVARSHGYSFCRRCPSQKGIYHSGSIACTRNDEPLSSIISNSL